MVISAVDLLVHRRKCRKLLIFSLQQMDAYAVVVQPVKSKSTSMPTDRNPKTMQLVSLSRRGSQFQFSKQKRQSYHAPSNFKAPGRTIGMKPRTCSQKCVVAWTFRQTRETWLRDLSGNECLSFWIAIAAKKLSNKTRVLRVIIISSERNYCTNQFPLTVVIYTGRNNTQYKVLITTGISQPKKSKAKNGWRSRNSESAHSTRNTNQTQQQKPNPFLTAKRIHRLKRRRDRKHMQLA